MSKAQLSLIAYYLIGAAVTPLAKLAVGATDSLTMLTIRFIVAGAIMLPYYLYYLTKHPLRLKQALKLIAFAAFGASFMFLYFWALQQTEALQATMIGQTSGLITTLFGMWILKETQSAQEWTGLAMTMVGSLLIVLGPGMTALAGGLMSFGNAMVFIVVAGGALHIVLYKKYCAHISKMHFVNITLYTQLAMSLVAAAWSGTMPTMADWSNSLIVWPAVYMAIGNTVLGYALYYYSYHRIPASNAILYSYIGPVVSIPLSVWMFGDALIPLQLWGVGLTLMGVYYANAVLPRLRPAWARTKPRR